MTRPDREQLVAIGQDILATRTAFDITTMAIRSVQEDSQGFLSSFMKDLRIGLRIDGIPTSRPIIAAWTTYGILLGIIDSRKSPLLEDIKSGATSLMSAFSEIELGIMGVTEVDLGKVGQNNYEKHSTSIEKIRAAMNEGMLLKRKNGERNGFEALENGIAALKNNPHSNIGFTKGAEIAFALYETVYPLTAEEK